MQNLLLNRYRHKTGPSRSKIGTEKMQTMIGLKTGKDRMQVLVGQKQEQTNFRHRGQDLGRI